MVQKQPNSRSCFVCGIENQFGLQLAFYDSAPGQVTARWIPQHHHQGFPGIVHGGILAAVLDEAASRTIFGANGSTRMVVTASLEVRYRKPVSIHSELIITGTLKEDQGEIIRAVSQIEDAQGNLLATAAAVLVETPVDLVKKLKFSPDDWKVYPDGVV